GPKSPTLSTPGSAAKSPGLSTPGSEPIISPAKQAKETGRPSLCESHRQRIQTKLEAGLSAKRIHQDLMAEVQFVGTYQSVKRFVRGLKSVEPQRVWRVEVQPGEEAQVDFGTGAPIVGDNATRRRTWALRVVLSHSRKAYSEAVF